MVTVSAETTASIVAVTQAATDIINRAPVLHAPNGLSYATLGETGLVSAELERMVGAVPAGIASALTHKTYYFVPLTISEGERTLIADRYDVALSDRAVCHRNLKSGNSQCVFISTRLSDDRISVAFEFFINVANPFAEKAGISVEFSELVWRQVEAGVRGETSADAQEFRKLVIGGSFAPGPAVNSRQPKPSAYLSDEEAKSNYLEACFSDAIAIYMLSLYRDVDYYDLREREYPLIAPNALAERLRKVNELFPPNPGFDFAIHYKRRS